MPNLIVCCRIYSLYFILKLLDGMSPWSILIFLIHSFYSSPHGAAAAFHNRAAPMHSFPFDDRLVIVGAQGALFSAFFSSWPFQWCRSSTCNIFLVLKSLVWHLQLFFMAFITLSFAWPEHFSLSQSFMFGMQRDDKGNNNSSDKSYAFFHMGPPNLF